MGLPTEPSVSPIPPHVIGNTFVEQYYKILHGSPEVFYRLYQEGSTLSHPDSNGKMTTVTTTQGINDFILSLDSKNHFTEILTTDSQLSYQGSVLIQVTGYMIGRDEVRQRFSQSFFLVPQDCGVYFVLNDVFRFVDDCRQPTELNQMLDDTVSDTQIAPATPEQVQDLHAVRPPSPHSESLCHDSKELSDATENGGSLVNEERNVDQPPQPSHIEKEDVIEVLETVEQKKSYASILAKGSKLPMPAHVRTTKSRPAPVYHEKSPLPPASPAQAPEITASSSHGTPDANLVRRDEGHSIFIRNLPFHATSSQVEEAFKIFGPIKPQGVQVRSHTQDRNCFGFVEFESLDSMQAAIEASSVMIEGRQVSIREKRMMKKDDGSSTRGRNFNGRGGGIDVASRDDHFKGGRGNFGSNQGGGFARNEFRNSRGGGDFSGRGHGPPRARSSKVYQPRAAQSGHPNITSEAANESTNQATVGA